MSKHLEINRLEDLIALPSDSESHISPFNFIKAITHSESVEWSRIKLIPQFFVLFSANLPRKRWIFYIIHSDTLVQHASRSAAAVIWQCTNIRPF